jgi:hypothetical protein
MKKLLFLLTICLIFVGVTHSQDRYKWSKNDTLISGTDSIYVDTLESKYNIVEVIVQDTGTVLTDSLIVETLDMNYKVWTPIAVKNLSTYTESSYVIAGTGNTRRFWVLDPNIYIIRIRSVNQQYVAGRKTYISLMCKN